MVVGSFLLLVSSVSSKLLFLFVLIFLKLETLLQMSWEFGCLLMIKNRAVVLNWCSLLPPPGDI